MGEARVQSFRILLTLLTYIHVVKIDPVRDVLAVRELDEKRAVAIRSGFPDGPGSV